MLGVKEIRLGNCGGGLTWRAFDFRLTGSCTRTLIRIRLLLSPTAPAHRSCICPNQKTYARYDVRPGPISASLVFHPSGPMALSTCTLAFAMQREISSPTCGQVLPGDRSCCDDLHSLPALCLPAQFWLPHKGLPQVRSFPFIVDITENSQGTAITIAGSGFGTSTAEGHAGHDRSDGYTVLRHQYYCYAAGGACSGADTC